MKRGIAGVISIWLSLLPTLTSTASAGSPCGPRAPQPSLCSTAPPDCGPDRSMGKEAGRFRPAWTYSSGNGYLGSMDVPEQEQRSILCLRRGKSDKEKPISEGIRSGQAAVSLGQDSRGGLGRGGGDVQDWRPGILEFHWPLLPWTIVSLLLVGPRRPLSTHRMKEKEKEKERGKEKDYEKAIANHLPPAD